MTNVPQRYQGKDFVPCDRSREHGEDIVDWAVWTGRIAATAAQTWRARIATKERQGSDLEFLYPGLASNAGDPRAFGEPARIAAASTTSGNGSSGGGTAMAQATSSTAYALNPLVDDLRRRPDASVVLPSSSAETPRLFGSVDLPPFTASGIDPALLRDVPWQARWPLAMATSRADALGIYYNVTSPTKEAGEVWAANEYAGDVMNMRYAEHVRTWAMGMTAPQEEPGRTPMTEVEAAELFGGKL